MVSLTRPDSTGPELFLAAVHQVSFMTAALVRSVCNKMGTLRLKSIPGENVSDSCEMISEMIKQIESSGKPPSDLLNLVSKPFTMGTQETFMTFAQQIHTEIVAGKFKEDEMDVIHKTNNFCQALPQNNKCEPAKGGKKDQDMTTLQGMIAELKRQVRQLSKGVSSGSNPSSNGDSSKPKHKYFECRSVDQLVKDCSQKQGSGND